MPPAAPGLAVALACLAELPGEYREVVWLVDVDALAPEEAARRLSVAEGLAIARLQRGRHMLARALCRRCRPTP